MGRGVPGIVGVVAALALATVVAADPVAAGTVFRVNPSALAFGSVGVNEPKSIDVLVTNESPQTLTPSFSGGETGSEHFRLLGRTCAGKTFAPGESCTITVVFGPREAGTFSATATIVIDQVSYPISMTGTGVAVSTTTTAPTATTTTTTARVPPTTRPAETGPAAGGATATATTTPTVPPSATVVPAEVVGSGGGDGGGDDGDDDSGTSPLLIAAIAAAVLAVVASAVVMARRRGRDQSGPDGGAS